MAYKLDFETYPSIRGNKANFLKELPNDGSVGLPKRMKSALWVQANHKGHQT